MRLKFLAVLLAVGLLVAPFVHGQGSINTSGQVFTAGAALSGTCTIGNVFVLTSGTPGIYFCGATNTWTIVGAGSGGGNGECDGRLSLTSGVPVPTADVTAATTIYWVPVGGNVCAFYSGAAWAPLSFAETSLALGTLTSGRPYDVFAYNNSGTLALELLAWTNDTTRATALVVQDGVLVKTGATTRRYLGTFYTTSTTTTEDSLVKRLVWNYYNRVTRPMHRRDPTASWTYQTDTWRQANGAAANKLEVMVGVAEGTIAINVQAYANSDDVGPRNVYSGIGEDSTSAHIAESAAGPTGTFQSRYVVVPAIYVGATKLGYHYYAWLERGEAVGTTSWVGTSTDRVTGIFGRIEG